MIAKLLIVVMIVIHCNAISYNPTELVVDSRITASTIKMPEEIVKTVDFCDIQSKDIPSDFGVWKQWITRVTRGCEEWVRYGSRKWINETSYAAGYYVQYRIKRCDGAFAEIVNINK